MTENLVKDVIAAGTFFADRQCIRRLRSIGRSARILGPVVRRVLFLLLLVFISSCGTHYPENIRSSDITLANTREVTTRVAANASEWRNSGALLKKGMKYKLSATGSWTLGPICGTTGPDGIGNSAICGGVHVPGSGSLLVGRIGDQGEPFAIGNGIEMTAEEDGILYLSVNGGLKMFCSGYVTVTTTALGLPVKPAAAAAASDVDEVRNSKVRPNKNAYAIVIGIEQYRQKLPKADFAVSDAKVLTDYLTRLMGYSEENIVVLTNEYATKSDFEKYFERWLPNNTDKNSSVFIYYSGHGAPDTRTGSAYLVPYDGDPSFITETGYSLQRMYDALEKLPAKSVVVALDSCFSGAGGRSVIAKGARPLVMNLQKTMVQSKKITVMAAASGDQISSTYDDKGHGLFTYYMLRGMKNEDFINEDGSLAVKDLFGYLKPLVESTARRKYNNEQSPQLIESKVQ